MLAAKRRFAPSVIQRLLDTPYRFQFFQAVRMLELLLVRNGVHDIDSVSNYLRFQNSVSLGFPASELESLQLNPTTITATDDGLRKALQHDQLNHIVITPAFMGFLGGNGTLPNHYTERIAAHLAYEKDESPRAFLDTFSSRAVMLLYEAWRKYRLEFKYDIGRNDQFLPLLLSLAGLGHESLKGRLGNDGIGVLDESLGHYAAALRQRPTSASSLQRILNDYFSVPIGVGQFVGNWYEVPRDQQMKLGVNNATLGGDALVGTRVWQRDLRLRLTIGPLDKKNFDAFLPGNTAAISLEKILTMFTNVCLEYEVQLVLQAQDVRSVTLNSKCKGGRLGWDTILAVSPDVNDRADVRYEIHAL
jgi:type VI secretion system protein ImpH